jgi:hypothetical protein
MPGVPHAIDAALLALGRQTGLSSILRALENSADRALVAAFEKSPPSPSELAKAVEMVRKCIEVVRSEAGGRGDLAELPRLETLSSLLEAQLPPDPIAARQPPLVPPPPRPAIPEVVEKPVPAAPRPTTTLIRPDRTSEIVSAMLSNLGGLYARRGHLLDDVLSLWRDFRDVDRRIQDAIWSMSWLEGAVVAPARAALAAAEDEAEGFAAALTLLCAGDGDFVLSFVLDPPAAQADGIAGPLAALRLGADVSLLARAEAAIAGASLEVRGWLLSTLADHGRISSDNLVELLDDPSDDIACRAAELVAWLGRAPGDSAALEARLRQGISEGRYCAFLYAAVALGSENALREVRRLMDAAVAVTARAIDALAVAGAEGDHARLLALAARDEALAPLAVLAAGHLGNPAAASALPSDGGERARRTILGDGESSGANAQTGRRLLYGHPWTLSSALARLVEPDELLRSRPWYALEVGVRTGTRPQAVFDATARAGLQDAASARIRNAIEARRRPLPDGSWFYFGQLLR